MLSAADYIQHYQFKIHPEGGYYSQTYCAAEEIQQQALPARFTGNRFFSTAIYFLLEQGNFSAFHRIKSDECWHFYEGQTLLVHVLHTTGTLETIQLGKNIQQGETFQFVVPAGCWFASEPAATTSFSLAGCTVAPGFNFEDFELAKCETLSAEFPQHATIIQRLTRQ
ncbi:cupin domain-containing protein [Limnovirga soli]|uniref:DUF985 domain-containing protein n=1 Tax=Limnovirga soli TaxID=2656915 RepID=A0A8J8FD11_9BACT|nr:cupin domain-containing protein [Limnovirga soli]NNV54338.1 hypothetical protein [Limnovirga soli]